MSLSNRTSRLRYKPFQEAYADWMNAKKVFEGHHEEKRMFKLEQFTPNKELVGRVITFQVTENCSLKCTYCYQINKSCRSMKLEDAKKFIDYLIEESMKPTSMYYIGNVEYVVLEFIGGEPLLEVDLIRQIIHYFNYKTISLKHPWAKNYIVSMISNGIHYFQKNVQELLSEFRGKLDFSMSIDGCKELHDMCRIDLAGKGSYDRVEAAVKHFMENYNPHMTTKMTIAPENIGWTSKAIINLKNLGFNAIHANYVYEKGWKQEHATLLYEELKKLSDYIIDNDLENDTYISIFDERHFCKASGNNNYCGSTGYMLSLGVEGKIYPCIRFNKSSLGKDVKDFSIGNLDSGIGVEQEHKDRVATLDSVTRRSQSTDECYNCPIGMGCGWCSAYNYQEFGTVNKRATYICEMHKARALANVYHWNKIYRKHNEPTRFSLNTPKEWALNIITEEEYNKLAELASDN